VLKGRYRKSNQRGTGAKFMGLKSAECNFNPKERTYNPHFHLLVPSLKIAKTLIADWLDMWGTRYAHPNAQHYRKVENREYDLVEVI
jgi:hypothetical protein